MSYGENRSKDGRDRDERGGFGGRERSGGSYGGRRRREYDRSRKMHKTICADCGKECEVPFKPTEGRPVYCKECFAKHRDDNRY